MKVRLLTLVLTFSTLFALAQSPWVQPKKGFLVNVGFSRIGPYSGLFTNDGSSYTTEREITDNTLQIYGEYGVLDELTLLLNVPVKIMKAGPLAQNDTLPPVTDAGSYANIGNIGFGARYKLYDNLFLVSAQLRIEATSSTYDEQTGLRAGYESWAFEPMISIGKGFPWLYTYGYAAVGGRTNNFSSYFRAGGELGAGYYGFFLVGWVEYLKAFENGDYSATPNNQLTGLYLNNQEYLAYGLKVVAEFWKDHMGATFAYGTAAGGNLVPRSPSYNFSLYYKWKPKNNTEKEEGL